MACSRMLKYRRVTFSIAEEKTKTWLFYVRWCYSILTNTPWSWVLLEKLPVTQLLKNFPTFYGTCVHKSPQLVLSWARSIQSIPPNPAYTANHSINVLNKMFEDKVVSYRLWPARSLDLTPCAFHLWRNVKNKVYSNISTCWMNWCTIFVK
jgi:hypothetical protein